MTAEEVELKPCPFCGDTDWLQTDKKGEDLSEEAPEGMEEEWFVVCGACGAMGPMSPSATEAHTSWNKRLNGA